MMDKLKKLKNFIGPDAFRLYFAAVAVGLMMFSVELCFVYVLQGFLLSIGLLTPNQTFLPSWYPKDVLFSSLIFIAFGFCRAIAAFSRYYLVGITSQAFVRHQRSLILEYSIYNSSQLSTHEIASTFGERVNGASYVLNRLCDLTIIVTSLTCLTFFGLKLAPIELLIGTTLLAICVYPLSRFNKRIVQVSKNISQTTLDVNASILISIKNNFFLKVHGLLKNELNSGKEFIKRFEHEYKAYQFVGALNSVVPSLVGILVVGLVSYISLAYIHTPGMKLVSFFYIFVRLAQGASDAYSALGEVKLHTISLKIIFDWNKRLERFRLENHEASDGDQKVKSLFEEVHFEAKNLGFSYVPGEMIFSHKNFKLGPGEVLLIQGQSGAGKSTLLSVLMGVNKPTEGELLVNGSALHENLSKLRNSLAFVGPEPFLKPGTIKENLLYGHPSSESVTDKEIWDILKSCHISDIVDETLGSLNQHLYEFAQLSTGQKQRLSLARALLRQPRLLILDEATANLDKNTEEDIINSLVPIMKKMTVIIVSHKNTFNYLATETIHFGSQVKEQA